ncbi:MAG: DUF2339 domain-containing protein [Gammaproteobacteria bacterium]
MNLFLGLAGAILGGLFLEWGGAVLGLAIGLLHAQVLRMGTRIADLESILNGLPRHAPEAAPVPTPAGQVSVPTASADDRAQDVTAAEPLPAGKTGEPGFAIAEATTPDPWLEPPAGRTIEPAPAAPPGMLDGAARRLIAFFTTGNVVAKVGIVIVFFGVSFLLRYAAEHVRFPIELRLAAVAAGALALLGVGWRLRRARPGYAQALQGGAVGVLYLTVFAALRLYHLVPAALAFALLAMLVALSGCLAVMQNARALAVLGTSGGFLAPILASTGQGSHVALFSYYLALNAGVLGIAWYRSWRILNWLGFVFTFVIGTTWGLRYYQPAHFGTTEPFLAAFFLIYLAVPVLYAHRQVPALRGFVDASLVFGLPAISFMLQSALVRDFEFGRAWSAVVLSGLYLALARSLWPRDPAMKMLAEAFLALGVVFATIAVPLTLDGHWTAATWALEGAGLVWVGVRQRRLSARCFGAALQLASGMAFALMAAPAAGAPIANATFAGAAVVALAGIVSAWQFDRAASVRRDWEAAIEWLLLIWGLAWWCGALLHEIDRCANPLARYPLACVALAVSALAMAQVAQRRHWRALMHATAAWLPALALLALAAFADRGPTAPFAAGGWLAWPAAVLVQYVLLWRFEHVWPLALVRAWHAGTAWLALFLASWAASAAAALAVPESAAWSAIMWAMVPSLGLLALRRLGGRLPWPVRRFDELYTAQVPALPIACILVWSLWACAQDGHAAPLAYVPIANPVEIAQLLALLACARWWPRARGPAMFAHLPAAVALVAFAAANAMVGRIVHFHLGVAWSGTALWHSAAFHAGVSILWAVLALTVMTAGSRLGARRPWIWGAALLGLLVAKLFAVDLGSIGTVARIVSFLATGVLILVIGYFAPAPPRIRTDAA